MKTLILMLAFPALLLTSCNKKEAAIEPGQAPAKHDISYKDAQRFRLFIKPLGYDLARPFRIPFSNLPDKAEGC